MAYLLFCLYLFCVVKIDVDVKRRNGRHALEETRREASEKGKKRERKSEREKKHAVHACNTFHPLFPPPVQFIRFGFLSFLVALTSASPTEQYDGTLSYLNNHYRSAEKEAIRLYLREKGGEVEVSRVSIFATIFPSLHIHIR